MALWACSRRLSSASPDPVFRSCSTLNQSPNFSLRPIARSLKNKKVSFTLQSLSVACSVLDTVLGALIISRHSGNSLASKRQLGESRSYGLKACPLKTSCWNLIPIVVASRHGMFGEVIKPLLWDDECLCSRILFLRCVSFVYVAFV